MDYKHDSEQHKRINQSDYETRQSLSDFLSKAPIPKEELTSNVGLFLDRRIISRILFMNELYKLQLDVHGSIFEFGVRYGQNLALLTSFRGIHEPYNHNRKIIGFDTFAGFPETQSVDTDKWKPGDFNVPEGYEKFLSHILGIHEKMAPLESIRKFELVKGDATKTLPEYLQKHQETMISMAYFDFDIYKPTADCLKAIIPYLNRGAVIAFDEINDAEWPGETKALREVLGLSSFRIHHSPFRGNAGYLVYEP